MAAAGIDAFVGNTSEELAMANLISMPTVVRLLPRCVRSVCFCDAPKQAAAPLPDGSQVIFIRCHPACFMCCYGVQKIQCVSICCRGWCSRFRHLPMLRRRCPYTLCPCPPHPAARADGPSPSASSALPSAMPL